MKFVVGIILGVGFAAGGYWTWVTYGPVEETVVVSESPQLLDVFRFTLEDEVKKRNDVVSEAGYTPELLLQVFPGLVESDFENVTASGGVYTIDSGALEFTRDETGLVPTTSGGLNRDGYSQLLQNILVRLQINLEQEGTLTEVITAIAKPR